VTARWAWQAVRVVRQLERHHCPGPNVVSALLLCVVAALLVSDGEARSAPPHGIHSGTRTGGDA
jgi:hypothetical protein